MKVATRALVLGVLFCFTAFNHPAVANSGSPYLVIRESLPNGSARLTVIQEDPRLRDVQSRISQMVIFKKDFSPSEMPALIQIENKYRNNEIAEEPVHLPLAGKPLWIPVKNEWTLQDEDDYSNWFASLDNTTFNQGTGLLGDCADIGLLFRWVYARDHKLPIANTLDGGKLFGHFSGSDEWDQLPQDPDWKKDERFKAALRYLFDNTYTHTVFADMYPTLINPHYVRAGTMFMIIRKADGHTQTIFKVDPSLGIMTYWGNEPAAEKIYTSAIITQPSSTQAFLMWRHPVLSGGQWQLTLGSDDMGYSTEQFGTPGATLLQWAYSKLGVNVSDRDALKQLVDSYFLNLSIRLTATADAIYPCYINHCDKTSADYDNYSTFERDARLQTIQQDISALVTKMGMSGAQYLTSQFQDTGEILFGTGLTYFGLVQSPALLAQLNPDPTVSFAERWGLGSNPTPTMGFAALSGAMTMLLLQRNEMVVEAYTNCMNGCDPASPSIIALNTADLDTGIRAVYSQVLGLSNSPIFDSTLMSRMRSFYEDRPLEITEPECTGSNQTCTFDDVIWSAGGQSRMSQWTSDAPDPIHSRWGFAK